MHRKLEPEPDAIAVIRKILLVMLVASLLGTAAELVTIGHVKPIVQLLPILVLGLSTGAIAAYGISKSGKAIRVLQSAMVLCIVSGFLGIFVHIGVSASEAKSKDKTLEGMKLVRVAITGVAPPLAPAILIQIGLVGLAYSYKHPALMNGRGPKRNEGTYNLL